MASSQDTSVSSNSFCRSASYVIFLFKYHFLLHILRLLFLFSGNIMGDVTSKQQTTALFLFSILTCTKRHTELTKKPDKPDGKPVLCQRTFRSVFCAVFLHSQTSQFNLECMGPFSEELEYRRRRQKFFWNTGNFLWDCAVHYHRRTRY
jgi:hypothetical protein